MENSKKTLGAIAATMCVYSVIGSKTALAAGTQVGIITVNNLNVRSENNTSSKVIGSLNENTKVTVLEKKGDWYKIDYNGQNAWVFGEYVKMGESANSDNSSSNINKTGIVNVIALNLREGAGTNYNVVKTLPKGTSVLIMENHDGWYKINVNGSMGYVSSEYVSFSENITNNDKVTGEKGRVNADSLNLRSGAGTNYGVTTVLGKGTEVDVVEKLNGWYKVKTNGVIGYVSSEYISLSSDGNNGNNNNNNNQAAGTKGTISADVLNVRSGAGTNYNVVGSLRKGTAVDIIERLNGWYKISVNGTTGYVSSEYVNLNGTGGESNSGGSNETEINKTGYVDAEALFVRSGPGTSYNHLGILNSNAKVEILSESNGWYKIKYSNETGYICKDYVSFNSNNNENNSGNIETVNKIVVVTAAALNVRSSADTNGKIVATLTYGTKSQVTAHSNGWYKISVQGIEGWICGDYVKIYDGSEEVGPIVKETPLIESRYSGTDIANKAKEYIGVPYLWGGFTPLGFDCSGLVQYVYKHFGISVSRTTYYQVNEGQTVSRGNLVAGDLIFFTTNDDDPNDISHVGIYIGGNEFIHAPGPGEFIKISNLSNDYFNSRYYVAKRIVK